MESRIDKKLESRIARLEKLLASNKNEDYISDSNKYVDKIAKALNRTMQLMQNYLDFEKANNPDRRTLAEIQSDIDAVAKIYDTYL